jgi:hypothetical protein
MSNPFFPSPMAMPVTDSASGIIVASFDNAQKYAYLAYNTAIQAIAALSSLFPTIDYSVAVNWMRNEILNGTTGLSAQAQQDIYNMQLERDLQTLSDAKDRKARDWAKGNWSLPDGPLEASFQELELAYVNNKNTQSRDIRVEAEKIAIEMTKFAVEKFIDLVKIQLELLLKAKTAIAEVAASLASAAMASAHTQTHLGHSTGNSYSAQIANHTSMSSSWSTSSSST